MRLFSTISTVALLGAAFISAALAAPPTNATRSAAPTNHKHKHKRQDNAAAIGPAYASRPDVMAAADDIASRRDLDPAWVRQVVGDAHYLPLAAKLMRPTPKGMTKNWQVYRSRFVEPIRIAAGVKFWQTKRESWRTSLDHRRHLGRGDPLRPANGAVSRHRHLDNAGL